MKIFDYIDGAFYINLDYRTDRKQKVEARYKELGICVERFNAVQLNLEDIQNPFNDPHWHKKMACTQSHFQCIKIAKERGFKTVWIMEDDVKFVPNFIEKVIPIINQLKNIEWDMFFFGGEPNKKSVPYSDLFVKTNGVYGAHSYLVNHTFYDKILSVPIENKISDIIFLNFDESQKNFFLSKELLCLQDDSFESDLWGGKIARDDLYKNAYSLYVDEVENEKG